MKRKLSSVVLTVAMVSTLIVGCSSNSKKAEVVGIEGSEPTTEVSSDESQIEADVITTVGPEDGTHLEMWTFAEVHSQFYADMLNKWNELNPDKTINMTFTTYPYSDMHNKLMLANQSGTGAPDLCDVEIGQFPKYLQGDVQFMPLNDYIKPYQEDIVQARLDVYGKDDNYYGVPTHVGATVMYYNTKILSEYGIDYKTIETWEDFENCGKELYENSGGKVRMTSVDTGGVDWLWLAMAEYGEDYTSEEGAPNIEVDSIKKMISMQQRWLDEDVAMISPGGQLDGEEGFATIGDGKIAAFPKAMWYMSRFLNYMPEMTDTWAIAPCPVFEKGQPRSVGIGGTGTVVSKQSKNAELAAEFISWAKLSYDGNVKIWEILGFDTCNTEIWTDEEIRNDTSNKYISYFVTNPFDTLNQIKDEIGKVKVTSVLPSINEQFNNIILNNCFENKSNVDDELATAQQQIMLDYE